MLVLVPPQLSSRRVDRHREMEGIQKVGGSGDVFNAFGVLFASGALLSLQLLESLVPGRGELGKTKRRLIKQQGLPLGCWHIVFNASAAGLQGCYQEIVKMGGKI